jgi:hypothetical protein
MKKAVTHIKDIDYYDGFVSGIFDAGNQSFFLFLLAYDIENNKRGYGAVTIDQGIKDVLSKCEPETYDECEKIITDLLPKAEMVYFVTPEPSLARNINVQDLNFIEMPEEQKGRALKSKPDFIESAVLEENIKYWFN